MTAEVTVRTGSLSRTEAADLFELERTISRGLAIFTDVGQALAAVRDRRLYRATHDTFEAYCAEQWGFTDRRARQMIDAATTVAALPTGTTVPVSERQARELAGLDPDTAAAVMDEAAASGKPTAATIRDARAKVTETERTSTAVKTEYDLDTATGEIDPRDAGSAPEQTPAAARPPSPQSGSNRRPLPDAFRDAAYDLVKAAERVQRLADDDRFTRNAQQVSELSRGDLLRAADALAGVIQRLP